jgi:hypothetical protein
METGGAMPFIPFYELFREVADHETRTVTRWGDPVLPDATYGFLELFCDEPGCDCRRAYIWVISREVNLPTGQPLATISYGWETREFYTEWASFPLSEADFHELQGPALVSVAPQSEFATRLLSIFESLLEDEEYAERIARHYRMFRNVIDKGAKASLARPSTARAASTKGSRRRRKTKRQSTSKGGRRSRRASR